MSGRGRDPAWVSRIYRPVKAVGCLLMMSTVLLVAVVGVAASTMLFLKLTGTLDDLPPLRTLLKH